MNSQTKALTPELLWDDLRQLMALAEKLGYTFFDVMFEFAWGDEAEDKGWRDLTVKADSLEEMVGQAEREWDGKLGYDDLFVTLPAAQVRVRYCNDMDLHLFFAVPNLVTKTILSLWLENGWLYPGDLERVKRLIEYGEAS
ncbi:hypothetical protein BH24DEI2_BH24DEI2_05570 [soil metagenome]